MRKAKISLNRPGGTAKGKAVSSRLILNKGEIDALGLSIDPVDLKNSERNIKVMTVGRTIILFKEGEETNALKDLEIFLSNKAEALNND